MYVDKTKWRIQKCFVVMAALPDHVQIRAAHGIVSPAVVFALGHILLVTKRSKWQHINGVLPSKEMFTVLDCVNHMENISTALLKGDIITVSLSSFPALSLRLRINPTDFPLAAS